MAKEKCVKLTEEEIRHVLTMIYHNSETPKDAYWKRSAKIALKLEEALDNES